MLVERWQRTAPTVMRLSLRPNVKFTNGEPMDADAVVHSMKVFLDTKVTPAYANYAAAIDKVEKVDALTVDVHTKFPYPPFELMLTQVYVTPPKYWAEVGGAERFGQRPVGTGPFRLTEWVKDNRVVMERNRDYWGPGPQGIDRLVWRPVPDDTARVAGLVTGEYDVATNVPISSIPEVNGQRDRRVIETAELPHLPAHPVLARRASEPVAGQARPAGGQPRHRQEGDHRQPVPGQGLRAQRPTPAQGAARLRSDAQGLRLRSRQGPRPAGRGRPSQRHRDHLQVPDGPLRQDREVSEAIAGMLARAGIRTRMVSLEPGEFLRQLRNRELQPMAYIGLAPLDDPDFQMAQYRSSWRYAYIRNAEIDRLVDAGAREIDVEKRGAIYRELGRLMHDLAPVAFLFGGYDFYGVTRGSRASSRAATSVSSCTTSRCDEDEPPPGRGVAMRCGSGPEWAHTSCGG